MDKLFPHLYIEKMRPCLEKLNMQTACGSHISLSKYIEATKINDEHTKTNILCRRNPLKR